MINLYDGELVDMLPNQMSTQIQQQCVSYALKKGIQMIIERANMTRTQAVIDSLPEKILDVLAVELRTAYYLEDMDIETKRSIIKRTIIWHLNAGTPSAVQELISIVFGSGEVEEWFEYGDKPYYFKIKTEAIFTPQMDDFFLTMLDRVKNTRSHLRSIEIYRNVNQELFMGTMVFPQYRPPAIIDGYNAERKMGQTVYVNAPMAHRNRPAAIMDGFDVDGRDVISEVPIGVTGISRMRSVPINTIEQKEE